MKKYNAQLIFSILFFILISSNLYSQETKFDIVGFWNSVDISENQSKTIFSQDEYVTMTINGEEIDGRKFIIRGG